MKKAFAFFPLSLLLFCVVVVASDTSSLPGDFENELSLFGRSTVEGPSSIPISNTSYPLAADRTYRKDPLNGFKYYTGGWNISDKHYWASVAFSAAPVFVIAAVWLIVFGVVLLLLCCCYCCCRRRSYSYSTAAYVLSLLFLVLFTVAAIAGCILLYLGQGSFHSSTSRTLDYVVGQANLTVDNLRNLSSDMAAAKSAGVDQIFLPTNVQNDINSINLKINSSASDLATRTSSNSKSIRDALNSVELILVIVAAVMLLLVFLGLVFSIFGLQFLLYLLVLLGWVLVAATFILCGVFLLFHNVVGDTCVAMGDWVEHPHAHTALDEILPCVDSATANETLTKSKEVTYQLVNVVNQVVANITNRNFPPSVGPPLNYNQSGPLVPLLCNPFSPDLTNATCAAGDVSFTNASQVWKSYICDTSAVNGSEICTTPGRLTSQLYGQMIAAETLSQGIYYYGPFLVQLEDCTFVRDTFASINHNNCPGLSNDTERIFVGLAMVSAAAMLSLIFWIIYARERRHRRRNKELYAATVNRPELDPRDKEI